MTPDRDIDRVLDAWLAPGPTEMPDRVYLGVLDRIERVPQRRRLRLTGRFSTMTPSFKLAAAAVLLLTVGVAIAPAVAPPPQLMASPSPSAPIKFPEALQGTWVTDWRAIDGLRNQDAYGVTVRFAPGLVETTGGADVGLKSMARIEADERLYVETTLAGPGCAVGDVGIYTWAISGDLPGALTVAPVTDDCALRAEVMEGTFRGTGDCQLPNEALCLGPLSAGTVGSLAFEPRSDRTDPMRWRPDGLTFTVPDGWVNHLDVQSEFQLLTPDGAAQDGQFQGWHEGVTILARPAAMLSDSSDSLCEPRVDTTVPRTVDGLVAYVTGHPGLVVSEPEAITIGGHPGMQLDIDIAPTWTATCLDWEGASPLVPLFTDGGRVLEDGKGEGWWWGPGGWKGQTSDPFRIILLDIGGGDTVLIEMHSARSDDPARHDPEGQAALVAEAMPIVETFVLAD